MHEGAIAAALVQDILEVQEKEHFGAVRTVTVLIGRLHHVVPGVLRSHYDILKKECPLLARSKLAIEVAPVRIACRACGRETLIEHPAFACAACGSTAIEVTGGREMHLKEITGTEAKVKSKKVK